MGMLEAFLGQVFKSLGEVSLRILEHESLQIEQETFKQHSGLVAIIAT